MHPDTQNVNRIIRLDSLHISAMYQTRASGECVDTVQEYAAAAASGAKFPPLLAYHVTDRKHDEPALVAGFHRAAAYKVAGITECEVEIREGTHAEAWLAGFRSNQANGLRYSNADKRQAAEKAILLFSTESNRQIAERLGLSHDFITRVRKEMEATGTIQPVEKTTGKDGRARTSAPERRQVRDPQPSSDDSCTPQGCTQDADEEIVTGATQAELRKHLPKPEPKDKPEPDLDDVGEVVTLPFPSKIIPPPVLDGWGIPIQPHAAEAFEAVPEFKRLVGLLKEVQQSLTAIAEGPGGHHLIRKCQFEKSNNKTGGRWVLGHLDNAIHAIQDAMPKHTDCPYAHNPERGHDDNCPLCAGKRYTGNLKVHQVPPDLVAATKSHYGVAEKEGA